MVSIFILALVAFVVFVVAVMAFTVSKSRMWDTVVCVAAYASGVVAVAATVVALISRLL